jgi:hypothetical protein
MAGLTPAIAEFLTRLVRLDPRALVRVRGASIWSRVPWDVLVVRTVEGFSGDVTVAAADWLAAPADLAALPRRDNAWRAGMPAAATRLETMPTAVVRGLSVAAAETLRATVSGGLNGRAVGERVLRDALLDHVPITVTTGGEEIGVPQRLVQAVARMGFLGADDEPLHVVRSGGWIGLETTLGAAWWRRRSGLAVRSVGQFTQ